MNLNDPKLVTALAKSCGVKPSEVIEAYEDATAGHVVLRLLGGQRKRLGTANARRCHEQLTEEAYQAARDVMIRQEEALT